MLWVLPRPKPFSRLSSGPQGDEYLAPALELLNKHASQLDPIKAIEIIPDQWSVSILESFLQGALRSSMTKVFFHCILL